jgi:hypothetical protein
MVNDAGQLYTMEGVAAGLIMLLAAYIVVSTTSIYTTGDTHIPDMQLEQLGSDVLAMMDTPDSIDGDSQLIGFIMAGKGDELQKAFLANCTMRSGDPDSSLRAQVYLSYRRTDDSVNTTPISGEDASYTGRENAVRVTRWVQLPGSTYPPSGMPSDMQRSDPQAVLVEVLLWRA